MHRTMALSCGVVIVGVLIALADGAPAERPGAALNETPWACHVIDDSSRGADGTRLADVNGDGRADIVTGWEEGGVTRVYVNPGPAKAKQKWPAVTVGRTPSVEDAVFVDLDADGATDVVSCCEGGAQTVFVHWAPKDPKHYLDAAKWTQQAIPASRKKTRWMFAWPMDVDGRGGIDLIAGGKGKGSQLGWFEVPKEARKIDRYRWHAICEVGWIMSLIAHDMDGDGDKDIVISDRYGGLRGCRWLENPGRGPAQAKPWKNHFIGGQDAEVMFMKIADLDGDGLQDVVVATRSRAKPQRILYFRRLDKTGDSWKLHSIEVPPGTGGGKGVAVGDINRDGRQDIVLSCEGADKGKSGVIWLSYRDKVTDAKWNGHDVSGKRGIKYDRIELLDLDADGDLDILTCEEREGGKGMGVFWYENPLPAKGGKARPARASSPAGAGKSSRAVQAPRRRADPTSPRLRRTRSRTGRRPGSGGAS